MKNILVIGECFDDKFCFFDVTRLCPEGPFPVLVPKYETHNKGGAGNVVSNLYSLSNKDINVYSWHQKEEISKTRLVCAKTNHHFARIDSGDNDIKYKLTNLEQFFVFCSERGLDPNKLDCIVISEYGKGFVTKEFIGELSKYCSSKNIVTFLDTKYVLGEWSRNIDYVKINELEWSINFKNTSCPYNYCKNLLVTLGKNGGHHYDSFGNTTLFSCKNQLTTTDSSGAGDCVISGLVIKYLETKDIIASFQFGLDAATLKCSKKGVVAIDRKELDEWIKLK
jgi:bifunctional ADP-heptose synthase (sugar kinase/adenylyltransferase)